VAITASLLERAHRPRHRLAAHQGHADPLGFLLGLAIMWVFVRTAWAPAWSGG
jgi:hypothetical protein